MSVATRCRGAGSAVDVRAPGGGLWAGETLALAAVPEVEEILAGL